MTSLGDFDCRRPFLCHNLAAVFNLLISLDLFATCFSIIPVLPQLKIHTMFRPILRQCARRASAAPLRPLAARSFASATGPSFNWEDPLNSNNLLTEEERAIGETAERYCQEHLLPRVLRKLFSIPASPIAV